MTDLRSYIKQKAGSAKVDEKKSEEILVAFLSDNNWFGIQPVIKDKKVSLTDEQIRILQPHMDLFTNTEGNSSNLIALFDEKWPHTSKFLKKFFNEESTDESTMFYVCDFLLYRLNKELCFHSDEDISALLDYASFDLTKYHGDYLTFFIAWLRSNTKTSYIRDYFMGKRYTMDIQNQAYDFDEYFQLAYYLLNEEYITENMMYEKAADSKNFTDTWLYLAIHFICSLRKTDLIRIYHPVLHYAPEQILKDIKSGIFTDNDARKILLSITTRMAVMPFKPNKEKYVQGIGSVKFNVPTSCEGLFGRLFALAEAHRQIEGGIDEPIIRKISGYEQISRYMGDEIGELFLKSDFRSRSATKSYLQSIYMLTDDILGTDGSGPSVKGYILAALARSHKGSYGEFAATTFEYLKDAKFSGLTPEFVAFELFERGVLSFIPSTLLKMIAGDDFARLSVKNQTRLIKSLNLTPFEIENIVSVVEKGKKQAEITLKELISTDEDLLTVLHRIGSGEAFSKIPDSLCLVTAFGKVCQFTERRNCIGCKYEISTRSTFYLLVGEINRIKELYKNVQSEKEKLKYKLLIRNVVVPKLDEILFCIKESFGESAFRDYEKLIQENIR